uniref:Uncharacterized protein n=1 Tax=Pseudomonas phage PAB2 TaxID=3230129 RepID=A0AAU8GW87_9VIRU
MIYMFRPDCGMCQALPHKPASRPSDATIATSLTGRGAL